MDLKIVENQRDLAIGQIEFARQYTLELLDATPRELWFQIPDGCPTHIAWQVGHLAYSQYGLLLFRQRGRDTEDLDLMPSTFRKAFGRGTQPSDVSADQARPEDLLERLATVHQTGIEELKNGPLERLLEPVDMPFAVYPNKLGTLLFAPLHEHIHAGQIGVVRRMLKLEPVR